MGRADREECTVSAHESLSAAKHKADPQQGRDVWGSQLQTQGIVTCRTPNLLRSGFKTMTTEAGCTMAQFSSEATDRFSVGHCDQAIPTSRGQSVGTSALGADKSHGMCQGREDSAYRMHVRKNVRQAKTSRSPRGPFRRA